MKFFGTILVLVFVAVCEGKAVGKNGFKSSLQQQLGKLESKTVKEESEPNAETTNKVVNELQDKNIDTSKTLTEDELREKRIQELLDLLVKEIPKPNGESENKEALQENDAVETPVQLPSSKQSNPEETIVVAKDTAPAVAEETAPVAEEIAPVAEEIAPVAVKTDDEADEPNTKLDEDQTDEDESIMDDEPDNIEDDDSLMDSIDLWNMLSDDNDNDNDDDNDDDNWIEDEPNQWTNHPERVPKYIYDELAMDDET